MQIQFQQRHFLENDTTIIIQDHSSEVYTFIAVIDFQESTFLEYQKTLFEDFIANIREQLTDEVSYKKFRKRFESAIQEFNIALATFAEKIKQDTHFGIRGFVQVMIDGEFLSTMIGTSGIAILRK